MAPTRRTLPFSTKPGNGQNTEERNDHRSSKQTWGVGQIKATFLPSLHHGVMPVQLPKKHCVVLWPLSM